MQSPFSGGQAESPPPAYSPRDDQAQQQAGMTTSQMDTGGNQVMDTSNPIMHSEPVPYELGRLLSGNKISSYLLLLCTEGFVKPST